MATNRLPKDVQYLCRHIDAHSNGQAKVTEVDDNLQFLMLEIIPTDGYYRGAKLRFKLQFPEEGLYPHEPPLVVCLDNVYHPNIDPIVSSDFIVDNFETSNVCISLLDEWEHTMSLDHLVMAILFILYNPNPEDALSPYFHSLDLDEAFETNVRVTLMGGTLDGMEFPRLLVCEDTAAGVAEKNSGDDMAALIVNSDTDSNSANTIENLMPMNGSDSTKNEDHLDLFMGSKPLPVIYHSASGSSCICAELDETRMANISNKLRMCIDSFNNVFLCNPQVGVLFSTFFTNFRLSACTSRTYTACADEDGDLD